MRRTYRTLNDYEMQNNADPPGGICETVKFSRIGLVGMERNLAMKKDGLPGLFIKSCQLAPSKNRNQ